MSVVVVTGTDTGVGKTVATAALASAARQAGLPVAVCKPVQTGFADGDDDLAEIGRLAGVDDLVRGWTYPEPLAPVAAARRAGLDLPTRAELIALVTGAERADGLTLVEGAGGLLVELGQGGTTLRDLSGDVGASVLIVVGAGLGTLNQTALTLEALAAKDIPCCGLVIGSWPAEPGIAESDNRVTLDELAPLRAVLPAGAGQLSSDRFAALGVEAFDATWVAGLAGPRSAE